MHILANVLSCMNASPAKKCSSGYFTKSIQNAPFPSDLVGEGGVDDAGASYASVAAVCAQVLCGASF